jgi:glycosyltransferase involved in cell wall biosynthesis/FMN phosphatase YigB (HAD superfamily)
MTVSPTPHSVDVVSVDVWDTLIRRLCHPDEVKWAAAHFLRLNHGGHLRAEFRDDRRIFEARHRAEIEIGNYSRAEGYDDEYRIEEVWRRTLDEIALDVAPRGQIGEDAVRFELAFEERISYADPAIADELRKLGASLDLYILSDFYVSLPDLLSLVQRKHPGLSFKGGMVSCDQRVNKRTGRLYRRFQQARHVTATAHVHVGDNLKTDVEVPTALGVKARHYACPLEDHKREELNRQWAARRKGDFSAYWQLLLQAGTHALEADPRQSDSRFALGVQLAPAFVSFVLFAIEQAMEQGFSRIHYFTREGEILVRLHRAIAAALPHLALPEAELLEVSRVATFGASIANLSLSELNRFWTMYPRHSMRTLFVSLGVDADPFNGFLVRAKLNLDEVLCEPWRDERFRLLLDNPQFAARLTRALKERRHALTGYLAEKGLTENTESAFVVDLGWRGTIQDNLARVFTKTQWHGVYLALFRFLNAQPDNCKKQAFLFNDNFGDAGERHLSPQAPLEMLFNSSTGSVTGYERIGESMQAVRRRAEGEDRVHDEFTSVLQEGVLAATNAVAELIDQRALSAGDLRVFAYRQMRALLSEPPTLFARAYFSLEHNETFGVGGLVKHEANLALTAVNARSARDAWDALSRAPQESGWPKGFLAAHPSAQVPRTVSRLVNRARDVRRSYKLAGRVAREVWAARKRRGLAPVLADIKATLTRRPPPPDNHEAKTLAIVRDADLQDPALRDFNELMRETRATAHGPLVVAWLFPDIGLGSGGHMTLLRFVRHFRSLGIVNRIYIQGRSHHKTKTALRAFVEAHYGTLDGVELHTVSNDLHESDILIATHWSTAYEVYRWPKTRMKAYFIQDFEPYFYAKSSIGVFAENTYRMNLFGICASPWLHEITGQQFGMRGCFFYLGYEPSTYYPDPLVERDSNRVVVYMRPTTERRGTELLLAALLEVQKRRPGTRISIFGTGSIPEVGLRAEVLGLQNEEQLRRLHSGSAITLLTSLTNYSLMPIEAMACGSVVVDLDLESMRETFGADAPIVLVRPEPLAMADELIALLEARERLRALSERSITFANQFQWSRAFDVVTSSLFGEYFDGAVPANTRKIPRFVRGRGGSMVFEIRNGKRRLVPCVQELETCGGVMEDVVDIDARVLLAIPCEDPADDRDDRLAAC